MNVLAIDPGATRSAVAIVGGADVQWLAYLDLSEIVLCPQPYDIVVCEGQYVGYGRAYAANDMVRVAFAAGCHTARFAGRRPIYYVPPVAWKGSIPKAVHQAQVSKRLSQEILDKLRSWPVTTRHNLVDAIALGQWAGVQGAALEQYRIGGR